ncbi:MAG: hypothetical protein PHP35_02180 [Candidatus Colwellbacteria bacterium]|nr:hypothetical protein [Candidatus Colwellbacteria bacterium]
MEGKKADSRRIRNKIIIGAIIAIAAYLAIMAYRNACPKVIDLQPGGLGIPSKAEIFWAENFCPFSQVVY